MPHNTVYTDWYAIDGAPCSGKTTLVEALKQKMGWDACPDFMHIIYNQALAGGKNIADIQENQTYYRDQIAFKRLEYMQRNNPNDTIIYENGLPSDLVWHEEKGVATPQNITQACSTFRFRRVFILDMLPNINNDEVFHENDSVRARIHYRLWDTYQSLGYTPIRIPVFHTPNDKIAVLQRMYIILEEIQRLSHTSLKPRHIALESA